MSGETPKQRPILGRVMTATAYSDDLFKESGVPVIFTLRSGATASFYKVTLNYQDLKDKTYVQEEVNGREQGSLKPENVADITKTLSLQQYYPFIGKSDADDRIGFFDGSRRRFSALSIKMGLYGLVTKDDISLLDAKGLAEDIQTAKEHNLREFGFPLLKLKGEGETIRSIASLSGYSKSKVARSIEAAEVPSEMLVFFPDINSLVYNDYKFLHAINKKVIDEGKIELSLIVKKVGLLLKDTASNEDDNEVIKDSIIDVYKSVSKEVFGKGDGVNNTTSLRNFNDPRMKASKKVGRNSFGYSFSHLDGSVQKQIDEAISEIIKNI